jgi:acyl-CoA thioesterase-1
MKSVICCWALSIFFVVSCNNQNGKTSIQQEPADSISVKAVESSKKNIVFFGNSLTAGYGLEPSEAFPALIEARIDSLHLPFRVINAGISGETSADGVSRLDWILQQPVAIFILELGANDGLRGLPVSQTIKNLDSIIVRVKQKYPAAKIILAGIQVPPSMGDKYSREFRNMFPQLVKKNNILLLPFILEGVGGIPQLNQKDGIHPTAEGDKIVAENVWAVLKPVL